MAELDALRGLAALAVVAFHYTTFYQQEVGHSQLLGFGFPAGNYGVQLFFLISGFVIFMTLERTREAMDFMVSRFSRLFPAYWIGMAITAVFVYSIGMPSQQLSIKDMLLNLTMVQQILGGEHLDGSYWTLEVELFFYAQMLVWCVLGMLARIRWVIVGWLALAAIYAQVERYHMHFSYTLRELMILRHIPFFALGILFYRLYTRPLERRVDILLIGLTLATIAISKEPVFLVVACICSAIFALFIGGQLQWLRARPFVFLGGISYSLYLLHQAIGFAVIHRLEALGMPSVLAVVLTAALVLLLAALLTWCVERPAMQTIRNLWRKCKQGGCSALH